MLASILLGLTLATPVRVVSTPVRGSIEASLVAVDPQDGIVLAAQVARLIRWRGDEARDVHPLDWIDLAFSEADDSTPPELVALVYRGQQINLRAYRFADGQGIPRYYDQTGALVEPVFKSSPAPGYAQITELVQRGRGKRRHTGLDLKAATGTPVVLPFAGVVARVNWSRRFNGNCIEIVYDRGGIARFLHLQEVDGQVKPGARLEAGARLGTVGSTGRSNAPHLHYEIREQDGTPLDPLRLHGTATATLGPDEQTQFAAARASYDELLQPVAASGTDATLTAGVVGPRESLSTDDPAGTGTP